MGKNIQDYFLITAALSVFHLISKSETVRKTAFRNLRKIHYDAIILLNDVNEAVGSQTRQLARTEAERKSEIE